MDEVEVLIIGAGAAGLAAAGEAARLGAQVLVVDENDRPGGQLFKQIHKFFGSKDHQAGVRGYDIGNALLADAIGQGARVALNTTVYGIYADHRVGMITETKQHRLLRSQKIIVATGATENALAFPGCTLPGVMSAGAVQTMINLYRVLPARQTIMVGSGNVGLIVSYQILQAGGEVTAMVEAGPRVGGYGVHAAKLSRSGVPILTRYTIKCAYGNEQVEGVTVIALDEALQPVSGSERDLAAGCVAVAVGLTPLSELAVLCGCQFTYVPRLGGLVPLHDENMETTVPGIYIAGDSTGVEEASSAMEEGRLAGIAVAESLGYITTKEAVECKNKVRIRLDALRTGKFGEYRRQAKDCIIEERRSYVVS
jgi:thioredoxin reductase